MKAARGSLPAVQANGHLIIGVVATQETTVHGEGYPAKHAYAGADVARSYDARRLGVLWNYEIEFVRRFIRRLDADASILDIPVGTGRFSALLAPHFRRVQGVDISEEMLAVAARKLKGVENARLAKADAEKLPFADDEFDYCFSIRFFGHTPPEVRNRVFKELARVTRRQLLLTLYVCDPVIRARKFVQRCLGKKPPVNWYLYPSVSSARQDLEAAGLNVVHVKSFLPFVMVSRLFVAQKKSHEH